MGDAGLEGEHLTHFYFFKFTHFLEASGIGEARCITWPLDCDCRKPRSVWLKQKRFMYPCRESTEEGLASGTA